MKYSAFLFLFLTITLPALAQDELESRNETTVDLRNTVVIGIIPGLSSPIQNVTRNIDGSPYYYDEWATGIALLSDNLKSKGVQMKYSTFNNRVYYKGEEGFLMLDNNRVEGFALNIDDDWILFKNGYKTGIRDLDTQTFFRIIHDGPTKIIVHHRTFTRKSHKPAIATGKVSQEFRHSEDYYLQTEDGKFHKIKKKERHILGKLNKKFRNQVKDYTKKNNLSFKEDKDLAKVLGYYDKLISEEMVDN